MSDNLWIYFWPNGYVDGDCCVFIAVGIKMKKWLLLVLMLLSTSLHAQTYTQPQWGLNKGTGFPYGLALNFSGTWAPFGSILSGGQFIPSSQDILMEDKPYGTVNMVSSYNKIGSDEYKYLALCPSDGCPVGVGPFPSSKQILNVTGKSGYVSYISIATGYYSEYTKITIVADGVTVYDDFLNLFFASEYQNNQSSFMSKYVGASNNNSNSVGVWSFIPIPFSNSISITLTNTSTSTSPGAPNVFYIPYDITYNTDVPNTWTRTRAMKTSCAGRQTVDQNTVVNLVNATGTNKGRLLGVYMLMDTAAGTIPYANRHNPIEELIKVYLNGSSTPTYVYPGTEDFVGLTGYFQGYPWNNAAFNPNATPYTSPFVGLTVNTDVTWGFYRFFIMDPLVFDSGIRITWGPKYIDPASGGTFAPWTGNIKLSWCVWYYTE
jgi:hypothetical protein